MKKAILILILLTASKLLLSQNITRCKALNNYINYINVSIESIDNSMFCLQQLYSAAEIYKEQKRYMKVFVCAFPPDAYYYKKAIDDSRSLPANISSALNT